MKIINSKIYAKKTKPRCPFFLGKSGLFWTFSSLSNFIFIYRKDLLGKPALVQIREIGLSDEFDGGVTTHQMPGTLASAVDNKKINWEE
ncbi:hypothetical protein [Nitrosomonas ureae]|uniref:Uncharacterized protein n=1 Tax=Nitrosomonas ureae TaxID=44577 RepID=A0A1H2EQK5_9PROT|nr:hypothetical protein [Nitrosomonas ureae]ALQ51876.1 hypothetical protein ATY38_12010 [Nitrosomonas ureae]SDT97233.1 hypothetical protein SAMN05216406_11470 [Nitrosomonas ureae]